MSKRRAMIRALRLLVAKPARRQAMLHEELLAEQQAKRHAADLAAHDAMEKRMMREYGQPYPPRRDEIARVRVETNYGNESPRVVPRRRTPEVEADAVGPDAGLRGMGPTIEYRVGRDGVRRWYNPDGSVAKRRT